MKTLKMMFTIALSLLVCVTMLSACQPSKPDPQSGNDTATTTTEATTTTTDTVTTTTQATTTTTTVPTDAFTINEDRLSEIGKTFVELKEQYGGSPNGWYRNGGKIYYFQNSDYYHYFGVQDNWDVLPADDAICQSIYRLRADQLFNGLTETVSPTELAEIYGLEHLWSEQKKFYNEDYMSMFLYGDYEILIHAYEDYQIGPDSKIEYIETAQE